MIHLFIILALSLRLWESNAEDTGSTSILKLIFDPRPSSTTTSTTTESAINDTEYWNRTTLSDEEIVTKTKSGEFSFVVCIFSNDRKLCTCTGSLASLNKVLTAGQCFVYNDKDQKQNLYPKESFVIISGVTNIKETGESRQESAIKDYKAHPKFAYTPGAIPKNDVAIALLSSSLKSSSTVATMKIPAPTKDKFISAWEEIVANKAICFITGFGFTVSASDTTANDGPLDGLKTVQVRPLTAHECLEHTGEDMSALGVVCAKALDTNSIACSGVTGAPLTCNSFVMATVSIAGKDCKEGISVLYLVGFNIEEFQLQSAFSHGAINNLSLPTFIIFFIIYLIF